MRAPHPAGDDRVRVLHVLPSIDDRYGGPGTLLCGILELDEAVGARSTVLAGASDPGGLAQRIGALAPTRVHPHGAVLGRVSASGALLRAIWEDVGRADVVVAHSTFTLPAIVSAAAARVRRRPWVLAPHGSLDPYDVRKHARLKQLTGPVWRTMMHGADLWCITDHEAAHVVTFGARPRTHVVPPPIELPEAMDVDDARALLAARGIDTAAARTVTSFVGRFDVKKGIPRLLAAFDAAATDGDLLVLGGRGEPAYEQVVADAVAGSARRAQVVSPGWLSVTELRALWTCTDVFVLASDDENFGMAVAEAMAAGVPVVITDNVALADLVAEHAGGLVTTAEVAPFAAALHTYLSDPDRRRADGVHARDAVDQRFSARGVALRYRRMLDDLTPRTPTPDEAGTTVTTTPAPLARVLPRAKTFGRRSLNRLGIEISLTPFTHQLARIVESQRLRTVVDIGANEGQYARGLRAAGFAGDLVSVEPLSEPFGRLDSHAGGDPRWRTRRAAVGDTVGTLTINVAGNSVSSSALPMLRTHSDAAPGSAYVTSEEVEAVTVDSLFAELGTDPASTLLKIDVQGLESVVLDGAATTLATLAAVQLELSMVPLYEGQRLMPELVDRMTALGFELWMLEPGFSDPGSGRQLQCDGIFVRSPSA